MSIAAAFLVCFVVSTAAFPAPDLSAAVLGNWELTGVGGEHNLVTPERVALAFDSEGRFRIRVWEQGDAVPQEVTGRYRVSRDLLELVVPGSGPPESFHVRWLASMMVLQPVESEHRAVNALWFEKQPW